MIFKKVSEHLAMSHRGNEVRFLSKPGSSPSGKIITLIGVDGSGKSTQSKILASSLQSEFTTKVLYLGANINEWIKWRRYFKRAGIKKTALGKPRSISGPGSNLRQVFEAAVRWINVRRADRLRRKGVLVICDRWPQILEAGCMDGPSAALANEGIVGRLQNWIERSLYTSMAGVVPDIIVHLTIDYETSTARKPGDLDRSEFSQCENLMRRMREIDPSILVIDAEQPAAEVSRQLQRIVWDCLQSPSHPEPDGTVRASAAT
jgi:thymidylate kinase